MRILRPFYSNYLDSRPCAVCGLQCDDPTHTHLTTRRKQFYVYYTASILRGITLKLTGGRQTLSAVQLDSALNALESLLFHVDSPFRVRLCFICWGGMYPLHGGRAFRIVDCGLCENRRLLLPFIPSHRPHCTEAFVQWEDLKPFAYDIFTGGIDPLEIRHRTAEILS